MKRTVLAVLAPAITHETGSPDYAEVAGPLDR